MTQLRAVLALYRGHLLTYRRNRTSIYWTLAFPLFFLLMFGYVFGHGDPEAARFVMPGLFTITIISGSVFGIAMRLVTEREIGILRRHRATPVSAVAIVLAHGATAAIAPATKSAAPSRSQPLAAETARLKRPIPPVRPVLGLCGRELSKLSLSSIPP